MLKKNLLDDNDENDEYLDYHHKMKNRIELLENEESTLGKVIYTFKILCIFSYKCITNLFYIDTSRTLQIS